MSLQDKSLYVFKHLHELDKMPTTVQEAVFLKLFKQCEIANYSPKEAMKYKESWKVYNDNKNVMDFAIAKAEKLAKEIGIKQGIEQVVINAILKSNATDEFLTTITGLSIAQLQEIRKRNGLPL
jgi:hypothetical protein